MFAGGGVGVGRPVFGREVSDGGGVVWLVFGFDVSSLPVTGGSGVGGVGVGVGVGVGGGMIGGTTGGGVFWAPVGAAGPVPAAPVPVPVPVPAAGGLEVSVCRGTMPACAAWARKRKKRLESSNDRESFMAEKDGQLRAEKRLDVKKN